MSDPRAVLERAGRRFDPPTDALERLHERRSRKQRSQRIVTVAVSLALIGVVAGGFGWALSRGPDRSDVPTPASPSRTFAPEDLETIVLRSEETPGDTAHKQTVTGPGAVVGPLRSGSLAAGRLTGPGTGFLDARSTEFLSGLLGEPDAVFFGSAAVLYEDTGSASRAYGLLVDDFVGRDERARSEVIPDLGSEAAVVRGELFGEGGGDVAYLWRTGNLVLIAAGGTASGPDVRLEVRAIAEEMDRRARVEP